MPDCIRDGGSISEIAAILSLPEMQAWCLIRSSGLVPNEVLDYLNPSRIQRIKIQILDDVSLKQIADLEYLSSKEIVRFIEKNDELKQAFITAMKKGQMKRKKKQLVSVTIKEWPCIFQRLRGLAEECIEWIEARDPDWIRSYGKYIDVRRVALDPAFVKAFPLLDGETERLIVTLGLRP